ncbi:hypothetical protein RCC89_20605 [Cytophagaceae bacterium ABcell3]|nr:hypothetical protein RCC89_20605 [Cytophagaceae bacterium ABcell3]
MTVHELLDRALFYSYRKQWDKALEYAQQAVGSAPDDFLAYKRLSLALWNTNRKEEAVEILEKSIELNPEFASAYYNMACYQALNNNKKDMLVNLKKSIQLDEYTDYCKMAKEDEDFKSYWNDKDFGEVVESKKPNRRLLKEIFASENYELISNTLLKIDNEIPTGAVTWSSDDGDDSISTLLESKADKLRVDSLLYLYQITTMNESIEEFDGLSTLINTLHSKLTDTFEDILIDTWKNKSDNNDERRNVKYCLLNAMEELPVNKMAEISLWGLKSYGKSAIKDYEDLVAISLEKLPEQHLLRTELVNLLYDYLFTEAPEHKTFEEKQYSVKITLEPPPITIDYSQKGDWLYEKAALSHFHPVHVINGACQLAIQRNPALVNLVREKLPDICKIILNPEIDLDLRTTAVKDIIKKLGNKKIAVSLSPTLHEKSPMFLEAIGELLHYHNIMPEESKVAVSYLIDAYKEADEYYMYDIICALRWYKDQRVVPLLVQQLDKNYEALRREAIIGLGIQQATSAIPELVKQLTEGSGQCISAAAKSLSAIKGDALSELKDTVIYNKVLEAAKQNPRWATEALAYFDVPGITDDLLNLLINNKEYEATVHLANGLAKRGTERVFPELLQIGLDRHKGKTIGERYFVKIFRSIARRLGTPSDEESLKNTKDIVAKCDRQDLNDFINSMNADAKYAFLKEPTETEKTAEENFAKIYASAFKSLTPEAYKLGEVMFLGQIR